MNRKDFNVVKKIADLPSGTRKALAALKTAASAYNKKHNALALRLVQFYQVCYGLQIVPTQKIIAEHIGISQPMVSKVKTSMDQALEHHNDDWTRVLNDLEEMGTVKFHETYHPTEKANAAEKAAQAESGESEGEGESPRRTNEVAEVIQTGAGFTGIVKAFSAQFRAGTVQMDDKAKDDLALELMDLLEQLGYQEQDHFTESEGVDIGEVVASEINTQQAATAQ